MNPIIKRFLPVLLVLSMICSLFTAVSAAPSAEDIVTDPTGYTPASDAVYKTVKDVCIYMVSEAASCSRSTFPASDPKPKAAAFVTCS